MLIIIILSNMHFVADSGSSHSNIYKNHSQNKYDSLSKLTHLLVNVCLLWLLFCPLGLCVLFSFVMNKTRTVNFDEWLEPLITCALLPRFASASKLRRFCFSLLRIFRSCIVNASICIVNSKKFVQSWNRKREFLIQI